MEVCMRENPVGWFEIYVDDMERAKKFYETVLGTALWHIESPEVVMWAFPMSETGPGSAGSLVSMEGMKAGGNSTLVYFSCDDCSVEAGRVESNGGSLFKPKFSIGEHGFIALAFDTEGNMFGLHSMS